MSGNEPVLVDYKDLDPKTQELVQESLKVREKAYCPYSNFKVGAALLSDSGNIYTGCNVENASYGATICAERTSIVKAVSTGDKKFRSIAVVAQQNNDSVTTPCGPCRQVLAEFCKDSDIVVYCLKPDLSKKIMKTSIRELMPYTFYFEM